MRRLVKTRDLFSSLRLPVAYSSHRQNFLHSQFQEITDEFTLQYVDYSLKTKSPYCAKLYL